jgi:hypothetical protein
MAVRPDVIHIPWNIRSPGFHQQKREEFLGALENEKFERKHY